MPNRPDPYGSARVTRPRRDIADVAAAIGGAFSVDELAATVRRLKGRPAAIATVYRAVTAMASSGFLERVGSRDGRALYAVCMHPGHHHHVVCEACGRVDTAECPLKESATADGFVVTRHDITLYGLCRQCAEKNGG